jgi:hypothetical protein
VLLQDLALSSINVTETDVDQTLSLEDGVDPSKLGDVLLARSRKAEEEGDGAAVQVAARGRQRRVDVLYNSTCVSDASCQRSS